MGFPGQRLLAVLIALAVAVLLRPSEVVAADAPSSVSCGEADDVVLHNPPRPALMPRHQGADLDDEDRYLGAAGPGELVQWRELDGPTSRLSPSRVQSDVRWRSIGTWHPPSRGPPAR